MMGGSGEMMEGSEEMMEGSEEMMGGSGEMMGGKGEMMGGSGEMMGGSGEIVEVGDDGWEGKELDAVCTDLMTFLSRLLNQNQLLKHSLFLPTICGFHFANSDIQRKLWGGGGGFERFVQS